MRIIAGSLRRRALKAPKGHLTRPTTDRARESLFNMLTARMHFPGADVLDLFAGTGSLGLEAISRGAAAVTFVEEKSAVMKIARENAVNLGVDDQAMFLRADAVLYLKRYRGPAFDLIFADPPYQLEAMPQMPDLALPHVKPGGLFVLEHDKNHDFAEHSAFLKARPYGRTTVTLFQRPEADEEPQAEAEG